ncbi:MAG: outer membrane beta-barrel protein [Balneolaceae bacterium]|nr:outer membrane beta-barrel protein [Balneolaceae bacterium]
MKKLLVSGILLFGMVLLNNSNAFAQNDLKLGGGLVFGSGVFDFDELDNDLGIKVDGVYSFNEEFRGNADLVFFFPKSEGNVDVSLFSINLNGNYIFLSEEELTAYGLAGINIAIIKVDTEQSFGGQTFGGSNSESELGLNLGAGVEYGLDFADLFGELKFAGLGGDADQLVIGAGLRFAI